MEFLLPKTRQIGKNLLLKDNTWMVTIRVPEDVKGKIGQSRLKKSLQTTDLALAERLKIHWLEQWRLQFDLIRDNPDISAMELGAAVDTFSRIVRRSELAGATPQQSFRETAILLNPEGKSFDEQKKLAKIHSQATGYGRQTKTIEYIDEFFEHQRYSKRVEIEASKYLKETFAVKFPIFETIDEQDLRDYCNGRLKGNDGEKKGKGLRPAWTRHTLIKYLNYIGQYWLYCQKQYGVPKSLIDYDFVAVGEIGIDLYWDKTFLKQQQDAFEFQIELALENKLPIVIHCRDGFDEIFEILEKFKSKTMRGIFHCFTGTLNQANKSIQMGFKLGIGGVVTFKNAGIDKLIKDIDIENIVLETDSPYLAPAPFRGKRNESFYITYVIKKISEIYNISEKEVAEITTKNSKEIFKI